jgi:hypothetical protein
MSEEGKQVGYVQCPNGGHKFEAQTQRRSHGKGGNEPAARGSEVWGPPEMPALLTD